MAAPAAAHNPSSCAVLPAIALALRQGDAAACETAALQLRDIVTKAPADAQAALCVAVASDSDVVNSAFVQALGRPRLSDAAQHALVHTMTKIYVQAYDICNEPSSAMMQACPVFLPILLRIMAQEQPVAACRYTTTTTPPRPPPS